MRTFGDNLKSERLARGMTQQAFAKRLGVTQQQVSQWELNKVEPTLYNIVAILNVLNLAFEDLLDGVDVALACGFQSPAN